MILMSIKHYVDIKLKSVVLKPIFKTNLKVYDRLALIPRNEQSDLAVTMPNC